MPRSARDRPGRARPGSRARGPAASWNRRGGDRPVAAPVRAVHDDRAASGPSNAPPSPRRTGRLTVTTRAARRAQRASRPQPNSRARRPRQTGDVAQHRRRCRGRRRRPARRCARPGRAPTGMPMYAMPWYEVAQAGLERGTRVPALGADHGQGDARRHCAPHAADEPAGRRTRRGGPRRSRVPLWRPPARSRPAIGGGGRRPAPYPPPAEHRLREVGTRKPAARRDADRGGCDTRPGGVRPFGQAARQRAITVTSVPARGQPGSRSGRPANRTPPLVGRTSIARCGVTDGRGPGGLDPATTGCVMAAYSSIDPADSVSQFQRSTRSRQATPAQLRPLLSRKVERSAGSPRPRRAGRRIAQLAQRPEAVIEDDPAHPREIARDDRHACRERTRTACSASRAR